MSTDVNIAKQIVHDRLESQIKTAKARLDVLAGRAEGKAVKVEVKVFETLMVKLQAIQQKLQELKKAGGDRWEQTKTDLEAQIAEFEKSVQGIESKAKARLIGGRAMFITSLTHLVPSYREAQEELS